MAMAAFVFGLMAMAYLVVGLFFLSFWWQTKDRLFAYFCAAFWILAVQRIILTAVGETIETPWYMYSMKLLAYLLILSAIIDKNRSTQ
jgi:hypothetical protein